MAPGDDFAQVHCVGEIRRCTVDSIPDKNVATAFLLVYSQSLARVTSQKSDEPNCN